MFLPSTWTPFWVSTALAADSGRAKKMVAIPRLTPPGPYETSTLLTGPTAFTKYSYLIKVWLVIWLSGYHEGNERISTSTFGTKGKTIANKARSRQPGTPRITASEQQELVNRKAGCQWICGKESKCAEVGDSWTG